MKIKVNFSIPTKDFKNYETIALSVDMVADFNEPLSGQFEYKVQIPDFMFNELANTEPKFKTVYDANNRVVSGKFSKRELTRKFKKTQTSLNIDELKEYIFELTSYIVDKYSIEKETLKKKIFIKFAHSANHITNDWCGSYRGEMINQNFYYFIGYEVVTKEFSKISLDANQNHKKYITKIEYHSPMSSTRHRDTGFKESENIFLPLHRLNQSIESFEKEFSIIDWTEEREVFCQKINESFKKVNSDLETFLKNMTNERFDSLIQSGGLKLLK